MLSPRQERYRSMRSRTAHVGSALPMTQRALCASSHAQNVSLISHTLDQNVEACSTHPLMSTSCALAHGTICFQSRWQRQWRQVVLVVCVAPYRGTPPPTADSLKVPRQYDYGFAWYNVVRSVISARLASLTYICSLATCEDFHDTYICSLD